MTDIAPNPDRDREIADSLASIPRNEGLIAANETEIKQLEQDLAAFDATDPGTAKVRSS